MGLARDKERECVGEEGISPLSIIQESQLARGLATGLPESEFGLCN